MPITHQPQPVVLASAEVSDVVADGAYGVDIILRDGIAGDASLLTLSVDDAIAHADEIRDAAERAMAQYRQDHPTSPEPAADRAVAPKETADA